jgi:hypothetical protein
LELTTNITTTTIQSRVKVWENPCKEEGANLELKKIERERWEKKIARKRSQSLT